MVVSRSGTRVARVLYADGRGLRLWRWVFRVPPCGVLQGGRCQHGRIPATSTPYARLPPPPPLSISTPTPDIDIICPSPKLYSLTGTFITQYDVLSAAHCVFDSLAGVAFTDWSFQPGKQGRTAPYGTFAYLYVNFYRVEYPR